MDFNLFGQKIVIQDQAEAELAALAIQIVNEKVAELKSAKPLLGPQQISTLALLEIAGLLVKDRETINLYREELDRKCSALLRQINVVSHPEPPSA